MRKKGPSTINVGKKDKKDFDLLLNDKNSFFYNRDNKEIFIIAMIYGFRNEKRIPLKEKHSGGYFRTEYLNDQEKTLIKAIAVKASGSLEVLLNPKEVYTIAEEYAAGGISYIKEEVFSKRFGSYQKILEELLVESFERISKHK